MMRIFAVVMLVGLAGCASTNASLVQESQAAITKPGVKAVPVDVKNVDRGATTVTWDAITPDGVYACAADDMLRRVRCNPK
jgi:hypothetical protein